MAKYTGKNLAVKVGSTTITSGHLISVELPYSRGEVELTGAGQSDKEFAPMEREATCTINVWDDDTGTIRALFDITASTPTTVYIYPQGATSGKPVISASMFVTGKPVSVTHNQGVATTYTLRVTGAITEGTVA